MRPAASVGTGWNETAGKTTTFTQGPLRNQSYAKYADVFEKQTTKLLSWTIYISIDFMVSTPLLSRTTDRPKRQLTKWRLMISSRNISRKIRRYIRETNHYSIVDMEDIRYTLRQGRYSDKQTTKRSRPFTTLV